MTTPLALPHFIAAAAVVLAGCEPSPQLPSTGEAVLEFVGIDSGDIRLKLRNRTANTISFRGARDWWWQEVYPQGPQFECEIAGTDQVDQTPYPLVDGPDWQQFELKSGEEMDIVVSSTYLTGSNGAIPTARCSVLLQLESGAVLRSEPFDSRP